MPLFAICAYNFSHYVQMEHNILKRFCLKGKVALITGTTKGLGQSLAEGLAEAGATVVALDRSTNNYLPEFCSKLDVVFKRVLVDLSNATQIELEAIVDSVVQEFSHIDILINNAGITRRGEVDAFQQNDWLDVLQVNLNVPFYLMKAVSKHFIRQKSGKIINIASILSFQGGVRVPSYVASKHGLVGLTKSYAHGLAPHGINVNAIAPGFMETDMTAPLQDDQERNGAILARVSSKRWGKGDDLKGILIFLASSMSDFVNGAVIPVDGGWLVT